MKHLKWIQIRYQLWYRIRSRWRRITRHQYPLSVPQQGRALAFTPFLTRPVSFQEYTFTFLNRQVRLEPPVDWNYSGQGKLWTYNLNYFDYLHQPGMTAETGLLLIGDFIRQIDGSKDGLEPYPISLRAMNWIKFLSKHRIQDPEINASLYAQYRILVDNLEYHLLGNHLLENGFSLYFGAFYYRDEELYIMGKKLLFELLDEQILTDGGHFERSPMYHAILLERLLDCYNISTHNEYGDRRDPELLKSFAGRMLSWLEQMTFENENWPMVNDSTYGIASTSRQLFDYAERLGIASVSRPLSDSGYRMMRHGGMELCVDIGAIGPEYIPGHAHSDTLSFILHVDGKPVIVDRGISTYEANDRRQEERSTAYHNTVMIDDVEQSEIWGSFRIGRRAHPVIRKESPSEISASHTGYRFIGAEHNRIWALKDGSLKITDQVTGEYNKVEACLHFHPETQIQRVSENRLMVNEFISIEFNGADRIEESQYEFCNGFNRTVPAAKYRIPFIRILYIEIRRVQK